MAEYIDKAWAIEVAKGFGWHACRCINDIPAADVAPVVHGQWKDNESDWERLAKCSCCGYPMSWWYRTNYCPNCGAKMDMEVRDEN